VSAPRGERARRGGGADRTVARRASGGGGADPAGRSTAVRGILLRSLARAAALGAALAPALALDADRPLLHAGRDSWTRREGLPSQGIRAIAQGPDGYLWVGTEAGLARFDGVRFVVFDPDNTPPLRSAFVADLLVEPGGSLLVATWDGLYRRKGARWEEIGAGAGPRRFTGLFRGPGGRHFAMHGRGVAAIEGTNLERIPLHDTERGGDEIAVIKGAVDPSGAIWLIADNGKRLLVVDGDNLAEDPLTAEGPALVTAIAQDRAGVIWVVAQPGGLMRRDGDRFVSVPAAPPLPASGAVRLLIDGAGDAWIGYDDGTLARVHAGASDILPGSLGDLGGGAINALAADAEGSLWVGSQGLHRLKDSPVVTLSGREGWPAGPIAGVLADSRGGVWVAPQSGGLWRWDGRTLEEAATGEGNGRSLILALAEDRTGTIWMASPRRGIYWLDGAGRRRLAAPERRSDIVLWLEPCPEGRCVLAGAGGGVWRVTPEEATRMPFVEESRVNEPGMTIALGPAGRIWAGTREHGVFLREAESWRPAAAKMPEGKIVLGLHEDEDGSAWAATVDGGLWRLRPGGETATLGRRQGLPSDTIYGIVRGAGDDLWFSTPDGLARAARADLVAVAEGRRERAEVDFFGAGDGLRAGECSGGGRVASRAPDGRLWFATLDGVAYVDPAGPRPAPVAPPVVVEDLACDGRAVALGDEEPKLPAGTARCEIRYTAPSLRNPSRLRFRYRLEGLEASWTEAGGDRVARFSHLPPRAYAFRVEAAVAGGAWSEAGATLRFSIEPRLWQTVWFRLLGGAAAAGLAFGGYRARVGALKRRQEGLERAVSARTAELAEMNRTLEERVREGIERLRGAERMAAYGEMVAGVAHEVRHPIFSIRSAAYLIGRSLGEERETVATPLATLERETGRMSRLMDDLLQFVRPSGLVRSAVEVRPLLEESAAAARAGGGWDAIAVEIDTPGDLPSPSVDRDRVQQVIVNLLENARRHAAGITRVRLSARAAAGGRIVIEVANDGAGMDPDVLPRIFDPFFTRGAGTGLGLAIVQRIVRDHGGSIDVDSAPERGTRFSVTLPLHRGEPG
jgi:signal transduction histidine kinase/ligand-binding sensor domain-containing protein